MNCYNHIDREANGTCVYCGKFYCEECLVNIQGKNYCKEHVEKALGEIHNNTINEVSKNNTRSKNQGQNNNKHSTSIFNSEINVIGIISSIVALIALFLPYIKATVLGISQSLSLMSSGDGIFFLILIIATEIMLFIKRTKLAFILSVINGIIFIVDSVITSNNIDKLYGLASFSVGFYIYLLSSFVTIASPWIKRYVNEKKLKRGNTNEM